MADTKRINEDQILDISLVLAKEDGWSNVTIDKIARKADISESKLLESFPTTNHVVLGLMKRVSNEVFSSLDPEDSSEPKKDIILDALMCRVEVLSKSREAYASLFRSLFLNPGGSLFLYSEVMNIMASTLEIAGVNNNGLLGIFRKKVLAAIYLSTLRVWISDESPDFAKTMSFLDKRLQDAETLEGFVQRFRLFGRLSR